jgi:hypothetical protein
MSLAIAHHIRPQQSYEIPINKPTPIYNFEFEKPKPSPTGYGDKVRII